MVRIQKIASRAQQLFRGDSGPTATEYAILLALIVFAIAGSVVGLAQAMQRVFAAASDVFSLPNG
jgi:Flp pilus assembly pilin Flp